MKWKSLSINSSRNYPIPENWLRISYYEGLSLLFRLENAMRVFVYMVLKSSLHESYLSVQLEGGKSIQKVFNERQAADRQYGHIGSGSNNPFMYLNLGELVSIITSKEYHKYFGKHFPISLEVLAVKLKEIVNVRNSLAHFRPVNPKDISVVKTNIEQTMEIANSYLSDAFDIYNTFPSNFSEPWHDDFHSGDWNVIGSPSWDVFLHQSPKKNWISAIFAFTRTCIDLDIHRHTIIPTLLYLNPEFVFQQTELMKYLVGYVSDQDGIHYSVIEPTAVSKERQRVEYEFIFDRDCFCDNVISIKNSFIAIGKEIDAASALLTSDTTAESPVLSKKKIKITHMNNTTEYDRSMFVVDTVDRPEFWLRKDPVKDFIFSTTFYPWFSEMVF